MTKSERKLFIIEIVLSIIFLLNIFVKNILNDYHIFSIIIGAILLLFVSVGYEKDKNIDRNVRKKLIFYIVFYTISFLILEYGLGLFLGYVKSPYKRDIVSIIKNIFPVILIIISSEYLRYMIIKKSENNKFLIVLTIILFIIIDLTLNVSYYNLNKMDDLLTYLTSIFLTSVFKNFILTVFVYRYGMIQNIIYRLILELYIYIVPITPDLGIYLDSVLLMVYPILLGLLTNYGFEKEKKKDYRDHKVFGKIISTIIILMVALIVALNSNLFRYWMAVVATGSMEPTINIGDAIIVDKKYQKELDKLKKGDVLVFKIGKKIYTHRIIKIDKKQNNYRIKTKGDRKGQLTDSWTVTNKDVIGVVKYRIKYVGYPTVWLSRILEENNE